MKKIVISSLILLAALAGCSKLNQLENQPKEGQQISLFANLPEGTKVAYASDGAANEGFTTSYDGNEHLFLWFEGKTLRYHELTVDSHTASCANFTGTLTEGYIPSSYPANFGALVTSRKLFSRGSDPWASLHFNYNNSNTNTFYNRVRLERQDGTADMATAASALFASGSLASADDTPTLSFKYLTSILKFVVTLPDGVTATTANTEIYVGGKNIYSYVRINEVTGELVDDKSSDPNSYIYIVSSDPNKTDPAKAFTISGQTITGYVCLWTGASGIKISDAEIQVVVDGTHTYKTTLATDTGSTIAPGKVYTFAPAGKLAFDNVEKWTNDEASTINVPSGLTVAGGAPTWMTYNSGTGVVSVAENNTGSPRQGKLVFTDGPSVDVTQITVDDLVGSWDMHVYKLFAGTIGAASAYSTAAQNTPTNSNYAILDANLASYINKTATIEKLDGQSVISSTYASGIYQKSKEHTNNITIEGFSDAGLLVKAQAVINHEDMDAWVGLQVMQPFVSSGALSTPQQFSASGFSSYYAWLMPELCKVYSNGTVSSWAFNFGTLGSDSKYWIDAKLSVSGDKTTIYWDFADGNRPTLETSNAYKIAGLMVNPFNASGTNIGGTGGPSATTMIRNISNVAKTGASSNNAAWQYVYQGSIRMTK